jgi:hypothetical protein
MRTPPQADDSKAPLSDAALPVSPSLLIYLFADRAVPTSRLGVKAPLTGVRVDKDQLARLLFGVAFWNLRESRLVQLETTRDGASVTRTADSTAAPRDGIEGGILDVLTPGSAGARSASWEALPGWLRTAAKQSQDAHAQVSQVPQLPAALLAHSHPTTAPPATVKAAVVRWYGEHVTDPAAVALRWVEREAIAKGCLAVTDAHRHPVLAFFLGKTTTVAQRDPIAKLEPRISELMQRWAAFRRDESALFDRLAQEIDAALSEISVTPDT